MRASILCFLLAGCASYGQMNADLATGIRALEGQDIEQAFGIFGIPASTMPLDGSTVYVWSEDNVFVTGDLDENPLKCNLRLRAAADGTILSGDVTGNQGACTGFRDRLRGRL